MQYDPLLTSIVVCSATIMIVCFTLAIFYPFGDSKKAMCLGNLIEDLDQNIYFSYYRIEDFRCGYNTTSDSKSYIQDMLDREIQNDKTKFVHKTIGSRVFYNYVPSHGKELGEEFLRDI